MSRKCFLANTSLIAKISLIIIRVASVDNPIISSFFFKPATLSLRFSRNFPILKSVYFQEDIKSKCTSIHSIVFQFGANGIRQNTLEVLEHSFFSTFEINAVQA